MKIRDLYGPPAPAPTVAELLDAELSQHHRRAWHGSSDARSLAERVERYASLLPAELSCYPAPSVGITEIQL